MTTGELNAKKVIVGLTKKSLHCEECHDLCLLCIDKIRPFENEKSFFVQDSSVFKVLFNLQNQKIDLISEDDLRRCLDYHDKHFPYSGYDLKSCSIM